MFNTCTGLLTAVATGASARTSSASIPVTCGKLAALAGCSVLPFCPLVTFAFTPPRPFEAAAGALGSVALPFPLARFGHLEQIDNHGEYV